MEGGGCCASLLLGNGCELTMVVVTLETGVGAGVLLGKDHVSLFGCLSEAAAAAGVVVVGSGGGVDTAMASNGFSLATFSENKSCLA